MRWCDMESEPRVRKSSGCAVSLELERILPKGPKVVPFGGSYLEFYKVIPKRNYFGAFG